jgi:hypothetical protein
MAVGKAAAEGSESAIEYRVQTEIRGPLFTRVIERTDENVDAHRTRMLAMFEDQEAAASMGQMMQYMESGHREYYTIEYESVS